MGLLAAAVQAYNLKAHPLLAREEVVKLALPASTSSRWPSECQYRSGYALGLRSRIARPTSRRWRAPAAWSATRCCSAGPCKVCFLSSTSSVLAPCCCARERLSTTSRRSKLKAMSHSVSPVPQDSHILQHSSCMEAAEGRNSTTCPPPAGTEGYPPSVATEGLSVAALRWRSAHGSACSRSRSRSSSRSLNSLNLPELRLKSPDRKAPP